MHPVSVFQTGMICSVIAALPFLLSLFVSFVLQVSNSESTQQQMSFLNKQLLLLGEAHKLSMLELHHTGKDNIKVWWQQFLLQNQQMQHTELKNEQ